MRSDSRRTKIFEANIHLFPKCRYTGVHWSCRENTAADRTIMHYPTIETNPPHIFLFDDFRSDSESDDSSCDEHVDILDALDYEEESSEEECACSVGFSVLQRQRGSSLALRASLDGSQWWIVEKATPPCINPLVFRFFQGHGWNSSHLNYPGYNGNFRCLRGCCFMPSGLDMLELESVRISYSTAHRFPVLEGLASEYELVYPGVCKKALEELEMVPLADRPGRAIFIWMFPKFHCPESTFDEIRDELVSNMRIMHSGGAVEDARLTGPFLRSFAVYFHGVDFAHYFAPLVKSARPKGLWGGVRPQRKTRRGTRGSKSSKAIDESVVDSEAKKLGKKDAKKESKKEKPALLCKLCGEYGHKRFDCPKTPICAFCKKKGHTEAECRAKAHVPHVPDAPTEEIVTPKEEKTAEVYDTTLALYKERVPELLIKLKDPEDTGISFRTGTKFFMMRRRKFTPNALGLWLAKYRIFNVRNWINRNAPCAVGPDTMTSRICYTYPLVKYLLNSTEECSVVRVGGLVHVVDKKSMSYTSKDVRHDYVAVGDIKHKNPLYSRYLVRSAVITSFGLMLSKFKTALYTRHLTDIILPPEECISESNAMPESALSKELFFNLANARIAPYISDESAKNSISISISKTPLINLSKRYIQENSYASGCSDEAIARTREALMDFRTHLKEEQVCRYLNRMVALDPGRYSGGFLENQVAFAADKLESLN